MKSFLTTLTLTFIVALSGSAQSKTFQTLREKFHGETDVYSFTTSGFFARTVLRVAGEGDYIKAIKDVKNVRLVVVPKSAFKRHNLTVHGFIKFSHSEGFEELGHIRDRGDEVTVLLQAPKRNGDNRYLVVVEDNTQVVAIELKGYIDPETILNPDRKLAYSKH